MQTLINHAGETWDVEHRTSERLTHIGGYLVLCGELSCVVIRAALPVEAQRRGRAALLDQLAAMPLGTMGVRLWHEEDAVGE